MEHQLIGKFLKEYQFEIYVSELNEKLLSNCLLTAVGQNEKIQNYFFDFYNCVVKYDFQSFYLFVVSYNTGSVIFNFLQMKESLFDDISFLHQIFDESKFFCENQHYKIRFSLISRFEEPQQLYEWILLGK